METVFLFEVVIVVSIQAYIFAALSAIYIGSAIEPFLATRHMLASYLFLAETPVTSPTPARRSRSRSASGSVRSAPVSASATSSAR